MTGTAQSMAHNRYKQAAEKLNKAASLTAKTSLTRPLMSGKDSKRFNSERRSDELQAGHINLAQPKTDVPRQTVPERGDRNVPSSHAPRYPTLRSGLGFGFGFAAGTALFRLIVFMIGMIALFYGFMAGLSLVGWL